MRANNQAGLSGQPLGCPQMPALPLIGLAVAIALSSMGCQHAKDALASVPYVGEKIGTSIPPTGDLPPPPAARTWPVPEQDVLNQQARGYGLARMPELESYLNGLYAKIKAASGAAEWPGSVYILATPSQEAYATAAGNIYLSPSWIESAESEDEIVALLSHEFGHIYLHYHQIAGAVQGTDQAAQIAAVALAIAKSKTLGNAWTPVDTLVVGYVAGRDLSVGDYGRTEEISADSFSLNVSLKLGYSYDSGIKAFLERIASWEESNEKRRQTQKEQIRIAIRQQAKENSLKNNQGKGWANDLLAPILSELDSGLAGSFHDLNSSLSEGIGSMTAKHPDINARIERQAKAVDKLPGALVSKDPVVKPLLAARTLPVTAAILKNYRLASEALQDVGAPIAVDKVKLATSGPTATHALPLIALYKVRSAQASAPNRTPNVPRTDPGKVLELNFASPPDRAWAAYVERALQLQSVGDVATAKKVIDSGMSNFRAAPEAWPQAIQFYGQTQGWQIAKNMAGQCVKEHPAMTNPCNEAARSPAEIAEAKRQSEEKSKKMVDRMFQKWQK